MSKISNVDSFQFIGNHLQGNSRLPTALNKVFFNTSLDSLFAPSLLCKKWKALEARRGAHSSVWAPSQCLNVPEAPGATDSPLSVLLLRQGLPCPCCTGASEGAGRGWRDTGWLSFDCSAPVETASLLRCSTHLLWGGLKFKAHSLCSVGQQLPPLCSGCSESEPQVSGKNECLHPFMKAMGGGGGVDRGQGRLW